MAHRRHVGWRSARAMLAAVMVAFAAGCSDGAPPEAGVNRGQVIDQDAENPIAGVIVVGIYSGDRLKRVQELWRLEGATSCGAPPRTSQGLVPFLEAILKEQVELGDSAAKIDATNDRLRWANEALVRKK